MLTLAINLCQPCVAQVTHYTTTTTMYAMSHTQFQNSEVLLDLDDWSAASPEWYAVRAVIHITHPMIMAGSPNDILADFRSAAERRLVAEGLACVNDYGMLLWV